MSDICSYCGKECGSTCEEGMIHRDELGASMWDENLCCVCGKHLGGAWVVVGGDKLHPKCDELRIRRLLDENNLRWELLSYIKKRCKKFRKHEKERAKFYDEEGTNLYAGKADSLEEIALHFGLVNNYTEIYRK